MPATIEGYKRHKLAASAFGRIRDLLRGFERERAADRRLALVGMTLLVLALLVYLALRYFGSESVVLP